MAVVSRLLLVHEMHPTKKIFLNLMAVNRYLASTHLQLYTLLFALLLDNDSGQSKRLQN
jgi:hypothetical protein